jgi:alpha-methylacyl-CoA racemase
VSGPLAGVRVIELAGIGPAPYGCMLLADLGADVLRVDRAGAAPGGPTDPYWDLLARSRPSVGVDLKDPEGRDLVLGLVDRADVLVEGFRPGVAERLGLGPEACRGRNAGLVYARMTGWGQDGPMARAAGHDIDYIALAGALWPIGRPGEPPVPPLNLVGDFGGGGMLLAFGVVSALFERTRSGQGQVVDVAMVDGAASLTTMLYSLLRAGRWTEVRGVNFLDSGAHFYDVYETADGRYFAVGAIEPQFYAELLGLLGLDAEPLPHQMDRSAWPAMRARLASVFATRSRDQWTAVFEGHDACGAPVLSPSEAPAHPHNQARGTFVEVDGLVQPAPVPRFDRTPGSVSRPPSPPGADTDQGLADWGVDPAEVARLRAAGVVG